MQYRPFALIGIAALSLISGCSSLLDQKNVVGAEFANSRTPLLPVDTVGLTLVPDSAYSLRYPITWSAMGPSRMGVFRGDTAVAFAEFTAGKIPSDFMSAYGSRFDTAVAGVGVDSITVRLHFQTGSAESGDTLKPSVTLCRVVRESKQFHGQPVAWLNRTSLIPIATLSADTVIRAPGDTGLFTATLRDAASSPLFRYLDSVLLAGRTDTSTALFSLALKLAASGGNRPSDNLLTLDTLKPPQIIWHGHVRKPVTVRTGDTTVVYYDTVLTDTTVRTGIRTLQYVLLTSSDAIFNQNPGVFTAYSQDAAGDTAGCPAGYFRAEFRVSRDSLFKGLEPESLSILSAMACFSTLRDSSYSEALSTVDLYLQCQFLDANGDTVPYLSSLFTLKDTTLKGFAPGRDTSVSWPVDKYMAALTYSAYAPVKTLLFTLSATQPYKRHPNLNRISRILFEKRVRFDYTYRRI